MITTVTTVTTTAVNSAAVGSFALIVILTLIILLLQKEVISGLDSIRTRRLLRALNTAIVPLVVVFVVTVAFKVVDILS